MAIALAGVMKRLPPAEYTLRQEKATTFIGTYIIDIAAMPFAMPVALKIAGLLCASRRGNETLSVTHDQRRIMFGAAEPP
jgi:hypothetical protein